MVTLELSFKGDSEFSMQTEWWGTPGNSGGGVVSCWAGAPFQLVTAFLPPDNSSLEPLPNSCHFCLLMETSEVHLYQLRVCLVFTHSRLLLWDRPSHPQVTDHHSVITESPTLVE